MKTKRLVCFFIAAVVVVIVVRAMSFSSRVDMIFTYEVPELPVLSRMKEGEYRQKAVALDGEILQGTGVEPQAMASTAKMILGLAIMEKKPFLDGEKGEEIEITMDDFNRYVWYQTNDGSVTKVRVGEMISEYEALQAVFLASSNNMADTLAIWAFGSLENYREYATGLLERIGIKNTAVGIDASGFDSSSKSTAEDLVVIGTKVMQNPVLSGIVGLKEAEIPVQGKIENTNKILGENGILGVKTGFIGDVSGYCLVSAYEIKGKIVTVAVLGSKTRDDSFSESKDEIIRLQREITPKVMVSEAEVVGYYDSWWTGKVKVTAKEDLEVVDVGGKDRIASLEGGRLNIMIGKNEYWADVEYDDFPREPTILQRFLHVFGWQKGS